MSYGLKYVSQFYSLSGKAVTVNIYADGYSGDTETLITEKCVISSNLESRIIGDGMDFTIRNTFSDWTTLDDLLGNYEKQYKAIVTKDGGVIFEGFLICDLNEQVMLQKGVIRLSFTNYLRRLMDKYVIDTTYLVSLLTLIQRCLQATELLYPIRINSQLYHQNVTDTHFLKAIHVWESAFYTNDVETQSAHDILQMILTAFNAYLYQHGEYWHIERYDDIDRTGSWYEFPIDGDTEQIISNQLVELHKQTDFEYINTSQTLVYNSGANILEINLQDRLFHNLVDPTYQIFTAHASASPPYPEPRQWMYTQFPSSGTRPEITKLNRQFGAITNPVYINTLNADSAWEYGQVGWGSNDNFRGYGIHSRFSLTVSSDADSPTHMNISWKWVNFRQLWNGTMSHYKSAGVTDYRFHCYVRIVPFTDGVLEKKYIVWDDVNEEYKTQIGLMSNSYLELEVSKDQLNQVTGEFSPQINIPMSEVNDGGGALSGDYDLVVGVTYAAVKYLGTWYYMDKNIIGDVQITVDGSVMENQLQYDQQQGFTKKEIINLALFDTHNLNYVNGLYYLSVGKWHRTGSWLVDIGTPVYETLIDKLVKSMYNQLHRTTRSIRADIKYTAASIIKPLTIITDDSLFYDSVELIPFIVIKFKYDVESEIYVVEMKEYSKEEFTIL